MIITATPINATIDPATSQKFTRSLSNQTDKARVRGGCKRQTKTTLLTLVNANAWKIKPGAIAPQEQVLAPILYAGAILPAIASPPDLALVVVAALAGDGNLKRCMST